MPGDLERVMGRLTAPKTLNDDRRPWEKQTWESFKSFAAFVVYRDLGPARSLTKAVQTYLEAATDAEAKRKPESVRRQWGEWSSGHLWVERADAYTMHVDELHRSAREGAIERSNRRYASLAGAVSGMIGTRLTGGDEADQIKALDVNDLDFEGAVRALAAAQKIERLATGQATELARGAFTISTGEVERLMAELTQGLMRFVPEERQPLAAQWVMAFASGGGKDLG